MEKVRKNDVIQINEKFGNKGWIGCLMIVDEVKSWGVQAYRDMTDEEKAVVDSFQGEAKYAEVMTRPHYFLETNGNSSLLLGAPST